MASGVGGGFTLHGQPHGAEPFTMKAAILLGFIAACGAGKVGGRDPSPCSA